mmetsp:Transcript_27835/g.45214  ORF Transcript_27835/g.45214 Transcript_27835/m.45214 type:complete len:423 (+) Transcript_27835:70-1338(+)|eukprot:CAMPEP_0184656946 /NCGR_PEP_ID=MMETSP0308-20130426/16863_1 /TAXON_ID=38269 /ORGANISM="Gloeochaete witrockiana, Strain SAG 46.84" /LENGTH=422 /DNA_ID=CAMNT_0027094285 /DNA_START=57 /DNA_END=1325 /DNA_ORIENTATION=+
MGKRRADGRAYDVVIYGATGYTGTLVAEYFARSVPLSEVSWAIAGRSLDKLKVLKGQLKEIQSGLKDLDMLIASTNDVASLQAMCSKTSLILNCVGPYRYYGEPVVSAAVEAKTDYLDVNGEPQFIRTISERYGKAATEKSVLVVLSCGADSVPADLGVYYTKSLFSPGGTKSVKGYLYWRPGVSDAPWRGLSSGTWTTFINSLAFTPKAAPAPPRPQPTAQPPSSSNSSSVKRPASGPGLPRSIHYAEAVHSYVLPFPVADIHIIKKSNELLEGGRKDFQYGHYIKPSNLFSMFRMIASFPILSLLAKWSWTRKWLIGLKKEGSGPPPAERAKSTFQITFEAKGLGPSGKQQTALTRVSGPEAYELTAIAVAQCALCVLEERSAFKFAGGVVTPACLGDNLLTRLQNGKSITFSTLQIDSQ